MKIRLVPPYFEPIPEALDEAAPIDGATLRERFARMTLPAFLLALFAQKLLVRGIVT